MHDNAEHQRLKDKFDGMVSIPCKECGKTGKRIRKELAERAELIVACEHCGEPLEHSA